MTKPFTFWDKIARKYAKRPVADPDSYENTLASTARHLNKTDSVLEIGCGTGTTALRLAKLVGHITASDFSQSMLDIAVEKAREQKADNMDFVQTSLRDGHLDGQKYDRVLAFNLLHLVDDLESYLALVHDHVLPGGLFISKTACLEEDYRWFKPVLWIMQRLRGWPFVRFLTIRDLENIIANAGFELVEAVNHPANKPKRFIVARKPVS
ncbi:class I SAM-dependent methyltransferase [Aestuariispira insulae]|uniref:Ubiquinone/menaquinone biosynthesis C-methylase UbiE n=1 Tax=Aestuariispira insulae TaxID=1461337 RepID=A0A3D9HR74_9PROT|nr:class I SAM-dependent methyltransferase [Aestuariispira insulae]RED52003.1 ubiquinone/menaquinone biosynthesis C-methylase UbiE [Aestuariispira insulae]